MAQTEFQKCRRDFDRLTAPVNNDPLAQTTVSDLHSAALFELDLHEAGEQDPPLTPAQVAQLRRFTAKWAGCTAAQLIRDLWWFIENVNDETPDRTDRFFALRERYRDFLQSQEKR